MSRKLKQLNNTPRRWKEIKEKYGLTQEAYNAILQEQGGRCYICLRSPYDIRRRQNLAVDHCHITGKIRGLLCYNCNHRLLTAVKEDPEFVRRLLTYLTRKTDYGTIPDC